MDSREQQLITLFNRLDECTGEDVGIYGGTASVYTDIFEIIFKNSVNRIFNCDGYWKWNTSDATPDAAMLTEYKYDVNLKSTFELCKVLAQCVYYLKKFKDDGMVLPKVVLVGDKNECVLVPTQNIISALNCGSDFKYPASHAAQDSVLMKSLMDNTLLEYAFVYDIDKDFDIEGFCRTIVNIMKADKEHTLAEINEHNIDKIWNLFQRIVFGTDKKVSPNDQVSVFVHYITDHDDFIINDRKPNVFALNGKTYTVKDPAGFRRFRNHFDYVRSVRQKRRLRATCDRFIEDMNRRQKGEFYTPTIFVDYAHKMISEQFGEDWREKYVVWDCAWGTGNLTRDYKFRELYCSTLEQGELDIARDINTDATKFKYDFLNDDFSDLPEGLKKAFIEKKPILFLINPPYATAAGALGDKKSKVEVKNSKVGDEMIKAGMGASGKDIYNRFLYRICKFKEQFKGNINIGLFCNPKFMTGMRNAALRNKFLDNFYFINGIIFNAGHFATVSANWGITFNLWGCDGIDERHYFKHDIVDVIDGSINKIGEKILYNTDNLRFAPDFWKAPVKNIKRTDNSISLKSALSIANLEKICKNNLGTIYSSGATIMKFQQQIWILSTASNHMGNATCITQDNFYQSAMILTAARIVDFNWLNNQDEMMYPNIEHPRFNDFKNDSVVFSLFESKSQQSSLRNVEMDGKLWNVKNEFFFMSREEMMNLADEVGFEELYNDANESNDRYVWKVLNDIPISDEARKVLEKARDIVRKSFKYRKMIHMDHPEYHLQAWDAGWYQIKKLCSELPMLKEDMDEFKTLYKALKEKMKPMVYELGFLRK